MCVLAPEAFHQLPVVPFQLPFFMRRAFRTPFRLDIGSLVVDMAQYVHQLF